MHPFPVPTDTQGVAKGSYGHRHLHLFDRLVVWGVGRCEDDYLEIVWQPRSDVLGQRTQGRLDRLSEHGYWVGVDESHSAVFGFECSLDDEASRPVPDAVGGLSEVSDRKLSWQCGLVDEFHG